MSLGTKFIAVTRRMKHSTWTLLMILAAFLTVLPAQARAEKAAVINGWVRIANEDSEGNVLAVEIVVGDEEEPYLVKNQGKGQELLLYIGQWVVAGGTVTEDELGWKVIDVEHYALTSEYPDR